jgi:hypothetical protein
LRPRELSETTAVAAAVVVEAAAVVVEAAAVVVEAVAVAGSNRGQKLARSVPH